MAPFQPVALYGLEVPPGVLIPAAADFPATIRITMAAIDPTEKPEPDEDGEIPKIPRSTISLLKRRMGSDGDSELDDDDLKALLNGENSDESDEDEDDEANGGPSDPAKSKKAKKAAALETLLKSVNGADSDEEMKDDSEDSPKRANGVKKGKEIAKSGDIDEDDEDDDSEDDLDLERYVLCTLDTERLYQQPLDITLAEGEKVFFTVNGTHTVHLTGNYVIDEDDEELSEDDEEDDEDEYDLPEGLEGDLGGYSSEESDELDDVADPRITEIEDDDEEEEAPKLIKGKNKRPADGEPEGLDEMMAKDAKADQSKLSKKQLKKMKNNKGDAVAVEKTADAKETAAKETPASTKKVQFAKNLEQGPTGSPKPAGNKEAKPSDSKQSDSKPSDSKASESKPSASKPSASLGIKTVQGVTIDDRKIGTGRVVKPGDRVSVRYIGKLKDGKVFDSNKKGTPFSFKVGKGEVIKGWDIGIQGMSVGGERRLTIPAHLAYGNKAQPGIPANSQLQFDVKLLEIK